MTDHEWAVARDRERAVARCWLATLRWTWPGVVLVAGSVNLVRLSPWWLVPTVGGLAMILVGAWRVWRIARTLPTDARPGPVPSTKETTCPTS